MNRWTLVAEAGYGQLGIEPGDVVTVEPGAVEPILIHRATAVDYAAVRQAVEAGALRPLHPVEPFLAAMARECRPAVHLVRE